MKPMFNNKSTILLICMALSAVLAVVMRPAFDTDNTQTIQKLAVLIPTEFADWREVPSVSVQMDLSPLKDGKAAQDKVYDDTLMRTYVNSKGEVVQLALAYGKLQRQEAKIHRPELCYYAQGFEVQSLASTNFNIVSTNNKPVTGKNMLVFGRNYHEAVSYWIRIGDVYSESAWHTRLYIIKQGLSGHIPDGFLVRASSIYQDQAQPEPYYARNRRFLNDLVHSIRSDQVKKLLIK